MKTIVAATDLSEGARLAAARAAMVAKDHGAALHLVHVISSSALNDLRQFFRTSGAVEANLIDDAKRLVDEAAERIRADTGVVARTEIKTGHALTSILESAASADLLVLGAHGANHLHDLVLGTTAERLLATCKRPILVVKRPPMGRYERVLVPVDFSSFSAPALNMVGRIAGDAQVTMIHAFRVPFEARLRIAGASDLEIERCCERERQDALEKMRNLVIGGGNDARRIGFDVRRGDPSRVILAKETQASSDLIVIGKQGDSVVGDLLMGSVTYQVLAGSKCDVLVVHNDSRLSSDNA